MKILGIDYGQKRIGLAIVQGTMAFPFKTLEKSTRDKLFTDLMAIIESEGVQAIVLGLPLDMEGAETLTTRQTLNFRDSLARRTSLPIHLVNEALTSFDARERLREAGVPQHRHKEMLDQMAAVCILETYLRNQ
ncbi:MAG: Holliday junction resolvase RuvX [Desulfomicrobium sp.]|nr:Holliday junction resolvase RuvX [Pseudomonadota bacterium]MBV1713570.1 Holliday junction resolvase RuvX [Desulfomicrobium sp.]MBU4572106.1 Holliday junction resolvase RuvX [Pseudomonadota bacterium]MBU4594084.1 Holliday junction resolvase RuvX [Pseudomonadota bacterium]MBV1720965.1 Holliday junction resolvase RuvX [Desulfomicrobium sp.]